MGRWETRARDTRLALVVITIAFIACSSFGLTQPIKAILKPLITTFSPRLAGSLSGFNDARILTFLFALITLLNRYVSSCDKRIVNAINSTVDQIRDAVFKDKRKAIDSKHRINRATVFKVVKWRLFPFLWPTRGFWLVPIARSYDVADQDRVFWAPKGRTDYKWINKKRLYALRILGVAGTALCQHETSVHELPDLYSSEWKNEAEIEDYAKRTWVTNEMVRERQYMATEYYALSIGPKGSPIAVVVLDAYNHSLNDVLARQDIMRYTNILSALLNR